MTNPAPSNGTAPSAPRTAPIPFSTEEDWAKAFECAEIAFHKAFFMTSFFDDLPRGQYRRLARQVSAEIASAVIRSMHLPDGGGEGDISEMDGVVVEKVDERGGRWGASYWPC